MRHLQNFEAILPPLLLTVRSSRCIGLLAVAAAPILPVTALADPPAVLKTTVVVAVLDSSRGSCASGAERCDELAARLDRLPKSALARAELVVLQTGDAGGEPRVLVERVLGLRQKSAFGGAGAGEVARQELLGEIRGACVAAISETTVSPIYAAVFRAAEVARARCRRLGVACGAVTLFVHSDLRENVESVVRDALAKPSETNLKRLGSLAITLPPPARIEACGLVNSRERLADPSAIARVWSKLLGPDLILDPVCPRNLGTPPKKEGAR